MDDSLVCESSVAVFRATTSDRPGMAWDPPRSRTPHQMPGKPPHRTIPVRGVRHV